MKNMEELSAAAMAVLDAHDDNLIDGFLMSPFDFRDIMREGGMDIVYDKGEFKFARSQTYIRERTDDQPSEVVFHRMPPLEEFNFDVEEITR